MWQQRRNITTLVQAVQFHTAEEIEEIRRQEELIRQQEEAMQENQVNESDENSGGEIETEDAV